MSTSVIVRASASEVVELAAQKLVDVARASIAARGCFTLALAGGSTPRALYQLLASEAWRDRIDWASTHVLFGDERAVAPDHHDSNYRMAREALLNHVSIPKENIHRMHGEREDLQSAALEYHQLLSTLAPLDLVLLGMGADGHTASLFPHSPALSESTRLCTAAPVASLEPHVRRLTITFPAINGARHVWLIVTGENKAQRLQHVLRGTRDIASTPAQGVQPQDGELLWLLDAAASRIRN